jgi:hypothetical protein
MLFKETVAVYCENQMEHTNTHCGRNAELFDVIAGGTYSYRWVSEGEQLIAVREMNSL